MASAGNTDAQTCPGYTAGSTYTDEVSSNTVSAIYVNNRPTQAAPCTGTVYAWNYCYYDQNDVYNVEVAFVAFSLSNSVYTLRNGSYHLLHLDSREEAFTCYNLTLQPSEYFQIEQGDRVGACMRQNGDTDYLDILGDTSFPFYYVHFWSQGTGGCTVNDMSTSPPLTLSSFRTNFLHLYVDISEHSFTVYLAIHSCLICRYQ